MATRFVFTPESACFGSASFPQLTVNDVTRRRLVLAYDQTAEQSCWWTAVAPQGWTGAATAVVSYHMLNAVTSGGVVFGVAVEAVTSGDSTDLDAADSYDTECLGTATVPATAGYMQQVTIPLATYDSAAAADYMRFKLARKVGDGSDTAAGSAAILAFEIRDSA